MQANTLKLKQIHVQQDFFQELINGFKSSEQKCDFSKAKMPQKMTMQQSQFFRRKSLPLFLAARQNSAFLKNVVLFFDQYRKKEENPFNSFLKAFNSFRMLEEQRAQQIQQVQQIQQDESSKKSVLSKVVSLGKKYRKIKSSINFISRALQFGRNVKNASKRLEGVNLDSEYEKKGLYGQINRKIYNTENDVVQSFKKAIAGPMVMLNQTVGKQATAVKDRLQSVGFWAKLAKDVFVWILCQFFIPQDALDAVILTAQLAASAYTAFVTGNPGAGLAVFFQSRLISMFRFLVKIVNGFVKIYKVVKPLTKPITKATQKLNVSKWRKSTIINGLSASQRKTYYMISGVAVGARGGKAISSAYEAAKGLYIGYDILDTDAQDVKMMHDQFTEKSKKWNVKVQGALRKNVTEPLQNVVGDLQFATNLIRQVNRDITNTIVNVANSQQGIFGNYAKSYKSKIVITQNIQRPKNKLSESDITKKDTSLGLIDKITKDLSFAFQYLQDKMEKFINAIVPKLKYAKYRKSEERFTFMSIGFIVPAASRKQYQKEKKWNGQRDETLKKLKEDKKYLASFKKRAEKWIQKNKHNGGKRSYIVTSPVSFSGKGKKPIVRNIFHINSQGFNYAENGINNTFLFKISIDTEFVKEYMKSNYKLSFDKFFNYKNYYLTDSTIYSSAQNKDSPLKIKGNIQYGQGQIDFNRLYNTNMWEEIERRKAGRISDSLESLSIEEDNFKNILTELLKKLQKKFEIR